MKEKKNFKRARWIVTIVGITLACAETSIIGEDFVDGENFNLFYIDSISVPIFTVKFDSLITSQSGRLLLGVKEGTEFGTISSEAYFLLSNDLESTQVKDEVRFDSITIYLPMDGYSDYLDETIIYKTIALEQLQMQLELGDDGVLYNTSGNDDFTKDVTVLGKEEFLWTSDRIREIQLRLDDQWGQELFDLLKDGDEKIVFQDEFDQFLNGFRIRFDETDAPFIGFKTDSIKLKIHTTDNSTSPPESYSYDFYIGLSPYYSKITQSSIPENISKIQSLGDEVISDQTNNMSFIAGGLGYAVKIDINNLRDIIAASQEVLLGSVELRLEWLELDEGNSPPDTLVAQYIDETYADLTGESFIFERSVVGEFGREEYYTLDITAIASDFLTRTNDHDYFLLITVLDFSSTITSVAIGNQLFNTQLSVYVISNK